MRDEDEDYTVIFLALDSLSTLQANTFSGLTNLERLAISGDMLMTLEPDVFNGLTNLEVLYIDGGAIATVQSGSSMICQQNCRPFASTVAARRS